VVTMGSPDENAAGGTDLRWLALASHDRVAAMAAFIAGWYADVPAGPRGAVCSDPREPLALRAFYRAVAGRPGLRGGQNRIFTSEELYAEGPDDWIVFGTENQGCFHWIMDPDRPDPAVGYLDDHYPVEPEPMSGFLLQFCLAEAALGGPFRASAHVKRTEVATLTDRLRTVPLRPAGWLGGGTFHVAPGVVAVVTSGRSPGERTILMSSRHPSLLGPLTR